MSDDLKLVPSLVKGLVQSGLPKAKLNNLIMVNGDNPKMLRRCLCTQLLSQGDCELKEVVKQVRLSGF